MNRILVIQTAFLGDVILATPIISELKRIFPEAKIDVLVKKGNESLLANNPKVNKVYHFNKSNGKWKDLFRLIKIFRSNRYDLTLNLHRFASSGILTMFSGANIKYGFRKNPLSVFYTKKFEHSIGNGTHEVERNLSLITEFGAQKLMRPELYPSLDDFEKVTPYKNEPYYCMSPASVWPTKQLPPEKWIELIKNSKAKIYFLGGPNDKALCQEIINQSQSKLCVNLAGELSLLQSAALLKDAEQSFVNDSGPLHLSSAMNTPTTAFFCSTIPEFGFGPLAENSKIVEVKNLDCRPCGLHGHKSCPKEHFNCGKKMNIEGLL